MNDNAEIIRDMDFLHPRVRQRFSDLAGDLAYQWASNQTHVRFKVFETYRSPWRQRLLLAKGTTKARPWQSAHQYGLAVDFVPWDASRGWYWDGLDDDDWNFLKLRARKYGLDCPLSWDKAHVESTWWTNEVRSVIAA